MTNAYPIDKELVKLRNLHLPNNRIIVLLINTFLSFLPTKLNKKFMNYSEWKNGDITMHMFTPTSIIDKVSPCVFYIHGGGFVFKATTAPPISNVAFWNNEDINKFPKIKSSE